MAHQARIVVLFLLVAGCEPGGDRFESPVGAAPQQAEFLRFEYQVARSAAVPWQDLSQKLVDGDLTIEEVELNDAPWCQYQSSFEPHPEQVNPDVVPLDQTRAPYLSAFGHPRSMGFSFLITAFQARTVLDNCGGPRTTAQGLDMAGSRGSASGEWRPGESLVVVTRPELGAGWLGQPFEFRSQHQGAPLYFEHAVDSVSPGGFVQGSFRFLVASSDGQLVMLGRDGAFGMYNRQ